MMMTLSVKMEMATKQVDCTTAFIHAPLQPEEEGCIFMEPPRGGFTPQ